MTSVAIITPTFGNGIPEEIQVIIAGMLSEYSLDEVPELAEVHISLYPSVVMLNGRTPLEGPIYTVRQNQTWGNYFVLARASLLSTVMMEYPQSRSCTHQRKIRSKAPLVHNQRFSLTTVICANYKIN